MKTLEQNIEKLLEINGEIVFAEYYSHESGLCWKIRITNTEYAEEKIVICKVGETLFSEVIQKAIDIVIKHSI